VPEHGIDRARDRGDVAPVREDGPALRWKRNASKWVSPSRMLAQLVVSGNGKLEASRCWS
jgi:hypothetical protein